MELLTLSVLWTFLIALVGCISPAVNNNALYRRKLPWSNCTIQSPLPTYSDVMSDVSVLFAYGLAAGIPNPSALSNSPLAACENFQWFSSRLAAVGFCTSEMGSILCSHDHGVNASLDYLQHAPDYFTSLFNNFLVNTCPPNSTQPSSDLSVHKCYAQLCAHFLTFNLLEELGIDPDVPMTWTCALSSRPVELHGTNHHVDPAALKGLASLKTALAAYEFLLTFTTPSQTAAFCNAAYEYTSRIRSLGLDSMEFEAIVCCGAYQTELLSVSKAQQSIQLVLTGIYSLQLLSASKELGYLQYMCDAIYVDGLNRVGLNGTLIKNTVCSAVNITNPVTNGTSHAVADLIRFTQVFPAGCPSNFTKRQDTVCISECEKLVAQCVADPTGPSSTYICKQEICNASPGCQQCWSNCSTTLPAIVDKRDASPLNANCSMTVPECQSQYHLCMADIEANNYYCTECEDQVYTLIPDCAKCSWTGCHEDKRDASPLNSPIGDCTDAILYYCDLANSTCVDDGSSPAECRDHLCTLDTFKQCWPPCHSTSKREIIDGYDCKEIVKACEATVSRCAAKSGSLSQCVEKYCVKDSLCYDCWDGCHQAAPVNPPKKRGMSTLELRADTCTSEAEYCDRLNATCVANGTSPASCLSDVCSLDCCSTCWDGCQAYSCPLICSILANNCIHHGGPSSYCDNVICERADCSSCWSTCTNSKRDEVSTIEARLSTPVEVPDTLLTRDSCMDVQSECHDEWVTCHENGGQWNPCADEVCARCPKCGDCNWIGCFPAGTVVGGGPKYP